MYHKNQSEKKISAIKTVQVMVPPIFIDICSTHRLCLLLAFYFLCIALSQSHFKELRLSEGPSVLDSNGGSRKLCMHNLCRQEESCGIGQY